MLPFIHYANLDAIPTIMHGFFTREGGVSTAELTSANFVRRAQESNVNLIENHTRFLIAFQGEMEGLALLHQKHGAHIISITEPLKTHAQGSGIGALPTNVGEGDALISTVPGVAIGVITADCVPILISDTKGTIVAAVHAGWRGVFAGIIAAVIQQLQQLKPGAHFVAGIGPCLQQQNFEFGADLMKEFTSKYSVAQGYFLRLNGKYFFNLEGFVRWQLAELGVGHIHSEGTDTYSNASRFFSCRRSNHWGDAVFGAQVSAIGIKKIRK